MRSCTCRGWPGSKIEINMTKTTSDKVSSDNHFKSPILWQKVPKMKNIPSFPHCIIIPPKENKNNSTNDVKRKAYASCPKQPSLFTHTTYRKYSRLKLPSTSYRETQNGDLPNLVWQPYRRVQTRFSPPVGEVPPFWCEALQ